MKVLNFGSLNIDLVFSVEHFVREGETLASEKMEKFCGGKGLNQSIALAKAGAEVYHAGCVGDDGGMLLEMLETSGVDTSLIRKLPGPGGMAMIQVDKQGSNCILLYGGSNQSVDSEQIAKTVEQFAAGDLLLLQNEINGLKEIVDSAFDRGMIIALNPSPVGKQLQEIDLSKISWLILNEIEGQELTGECKSEKILEKLHQKYPDCRVVLTLGKKGSVYFDGTEQLHQGIYSVPVVDTTAAGDTFTGFFLASVMRGETPSKALEIASKASSIAVSRKGAAPSIPSMEEVDAFDLKPAE